MADKVDGQFRTWLKLWRGFGGALFRGYAVLGAGAVAVWWVFG